MSRMTILSANERHTFETPPVFDDAQRQRAFDLPDGLLQLVRKVRKPALQIGFILNCAYFSAAKRFFVSKDFRERDVQFAANLLGLDGAQFDRSIYQIRTLDRHQHHILQFYGYSRFNAKAEAFIVSEITAMATSHLKPKLIFSRCLDLLIREHVQLPSEHRLAGLIARALAQRKHQLVERIDQLIPVGLREALDELFVQDASEADEPMPGVTSSYRLTLLKRLSQSTRVGDVKQRTVDLALMKNVHDQVFTLLPALGLGRDGIDYFANSVIRSQIFQLMRRKDADRYLHVLAFIAHQYYCLQDNLVDTLLTTVQSHQNACLKEIKDLSFDSRRQRNDLLAQLLETLDHAVLNVLNQARSLVHDTQLDDTAKIRQLEALLPANDISTQEPVSVMAARMAVTANRENTDYYSILESRSLKLQNRVSPIIKTLDFKGDGAAELLGAISHFKAKDGLISKSAPQGFLDADEAKVVVRGDQIVRISLYKAFLFMHIARALKAGTLNIEHSYKYRSFDDYLISKERWHKEKTDLLKRADLDEFTDPKPIFAQLAAALHAQYVTVNQRFNIGNNLHLKIKANGKFHIATPKQDEEADEPLRPFLPNRHYVPLPEILATVNNQAGFSAEFQHWQQRKTKAIRDKAMYAGIMGLGCAIGTRRMALIASGVGESELVNAVNWHFSLENVRAANDRIIRRTSEIPLSEIYRRTAGSLHTASDGQKFAVRKDSLNANYSFKYFGKDQGASAYSFIDERQLLWHSLVFSSAERESAYVIDGLMRNDVVKSDIHSTDTHGYSEAIFAVTHLMGISYAPRIKGINRQNLYAFRTAPDIDRTSWAITHDKYVNENLAAENWDDMLRLIATIKLKESTASDIFRRLNSYAKQHVLYRTLKAFGQIIKSLFILRYLDDVDLRQAIEHQLNRVELANRFTRAVAVGSPREFLQGDKEDQEVAEACNRLIKNAIVCWNYLYLQKKVDALKSQDQKNDLIAVISTHSMLSWRHINLLGEYDFSDQKLKDSFNLSQPKIAA
jgi:TnpA family transposase